MKIIPGPWRVEEEKHEDGTLVIRSDPKGSGDVPGNLVVALVVGGGPEDYERNTANLIAAAPSLWADKTRLDWIAHMAAECEGHILTRIFLPDGRPMREKIDEAMKLNPV